MGSRRRSALAVTLAFVLVTMLVLPSAASAGVGSTTIFEPDAWENDDTTTTARVLPYVSEHTFDNPIMPAGVSGQMMLGDQDWFKVTAEASGTPFILETYLEEGNDIHTRLDVYSLESSGTVNLLTSGDSTFWQNESLFGFPLPPLGPVTRAATLMWTAPDAGTYYVRVSQGSSQADSPAGVSEQRASGWGSGKYLLYQSKGIARRVAGADRYATSVMVSRTMFPEASVPAFFPVFIVGTEGVSGQTLFGAPRIVFVASGENFPDAMAGASCAGRSGTSLLLTKKDELPPVVAAEIQRLAANSYWQQGGFDVVILGGTAAVSQAVEDAIAKIQGVTRIERLAGKDRYETAATIATETIEFFRSASGQARAQSLGAWTGGVKGQIAAETSKTAFVVNGGAWADAVSCGPCAAYNGYPVLLTYKDDLPAVSGAAIASLGIEKAVIVGSDKVVGNAVYAELETQLGIGNVTRVGGADRYDTAELFAIWSVANAGMNPGAFLLTSGGNFPDSLSAGPMGRWMGGVTLLTGPTSLAPKTADYLDNHYGYNEWPSYVIGGPAVVSDGIVNAINGLRFEPH